MEEEKIKKMENGFQVKYGGGNFMIEFFNKEEEDYNTMLLLIAFFNKYKSEEQIKRLYNLLFVTLFETTLNDEENWRRFKTMFKAIRDARNHKE